MLGVTICGGDHGRRYHCIQMQREANVRTTLSRFLAALTALGIDKKMISRFVQLGAM